MIERFAGIVVTAVVLHCGVETENSAIDTGVLPPSISTSSGGGGSGSAGTASRDSTAIDENFAGAGAVDISDAAIWDSAVGSEPGDAATDDLAAVARSIDKFQLLDPCDLTSYTVQPGLAAVCPQKTDVKNQHVSLQIAGDPNVTYDLTLRVRAIVEHYWYAGGTLDPVSKTFYRGGVPTIGGYSTACKNMASTLPFQLPAEITPTDGCFNGFNVFTMLVSAPTQHFYLNYTTDKDVDRPPHMVYQDDYTVTVPMNGQAKLDFYVIGSDEHECYNHDKVVPGVSLPSSPYIGEFVQFDVVDTRRH
jgi:hypothetical protein